MAVALDRAGYDRGVTLTRPPRDARQACARLAHTLRREYGTWEWVWTLEAPPNNPKHVHLHGVVRSPYIPVARLSRLARDAGWKPHVWLSAKEGQAARYMAKYFTKSLAAGYDAALTLNGGRRVMHWSRGYTAGVPMRDFVREHAPAQDAGPWVMVNAVDVPASILTAREFVAAQHEWREAAAGARDAARSKLALEQADVLAVLAPLEPVPSDAASSGRVGAARRREDGDAFAGYRWAEDRRRRWLARGVTSEPTQTNDACEPTRVNRPV